MESSIARRTLAGAVTAAALVACSSGVPRSATNPGVDLPAGEIRLYGYDPDGRALTYDSFVDLQTNGHGPEYVNDTIVDPLDLEVRVTNPIEEAASGVRLDRPGGPAALTVTWPSASGYSTVIVDLPEPGRYFWNLLLARQAVADAERWNSGAPTGTAEFQAWSTVHARAAELLTTAEALRLTDPVRAAALADDSFDLAVEASLLPRHQRDRSAVQAGVTIDTRDVPSDIWAGIVNLAGDREPWVRIVFDADEPATSYVPMVRAAHDAGVRVLGQFLDSSEMASFPLAQFQERVRTYVATLSVEAWEVGNEINGSWLGPDAAEKSRWAADYVKRNTDAVTVLTLYWLLGEDEPEWSTFNWVHTNVDTAWRDDLDMIALSTWVEEHPLGISFDRVFAALARQFPNQQLVVGELGYGSADLEHVWWWGDPADKLGAGRLAVAHDYMTLAADRPWLLGGGYWWYYAEEAFPVNDLWHALADT